MHSDKNIYKIVETNDIGNFEEKTNKISKILTLPIFSHRDISMPTLPICSP